MTPSITQEYLTHLHGTLEYYETLANAVAERMRVPGAIDMSTHVYWEDLSKQIVKLQNEIDTLSFVLAV